MRRLLPLLALTLVLSVAGCQDNGTTPEDGFTGTYTLVSINETPLPLLLVDQDSLNVRVTGGAITLNQDGTFSDRTTYLVDKSGAVQSEDDVYSGTFAKSDTGATLIPGDGSEPYFVYIAGSQMTQVIGMYELEYSK